MNYPSPAAMRGFTLLELVIAMTLAALVAVIGAAALSAGTDFYERARKRLKDHEDLRAAQRVIRLEWESRLPRAIDAEASWVEFEPRTRAFTGPVQGGQKVRYRCEPDARGFYTLWHELLPYAPASPPPQGQAGAATAQQPKRGVAQPILQEILAEELLRCDFSFLPPIQKTPGAQAEARWLQYWDGQTAPPSIMRVRLDAYRGELPPLVFVVRQ